MGQGAGVTPLWLLGPSAGGRSFVFIQRSKGKCGGVEQGLARPHSQICHGLCTECAKREFQGASWGDQSAGCAPVQNGGQGQGTKVLAVRKSGQVPDAKSLGWILCQVVQTQFNSTAPMWQVILSAGVPPHGCVTLFLWVTTSICKIYIYIKCKICKIYILCIYIYIYTHTHTHMCVCVWKRNGME